MYQSLLHLSWIDKLLDNIKTLIISLYSEQLKKSHTSAVHCDFDAYFNQQVKELEGSQDQNAQINLMPEASLHSTSATVLDNVIPPPVPGLVKCKLYLSSQ